MPTSPHNSIEPKRYYWILTALFIAIGSMAVYMDQLWLTLVVPVLAIGLALMSVSHERLYILLFFLIPFSIEIELPGGLGTDLPTEPLLWLITGIGMVYIISKPKLSLSKGYALLLLVQFIWGVLAMLFAEFPLISLKYLLAKTWYVIPFYFLPFYIFRSDRIWIKLLQILLIATLIAGSYTFINHGLSGWTFSSRTLAGAPFFRNHVNYACLLLLCLPASYYLYQETREKRYVLLLSIFLLFLQFTYARIAYVAIAVALIAMFSLRYKLLRAVMIIGMTCIVGVSIYMLSGDRINRLAPEYDKTISHQRFDRLVEATYQLQDISSMERAYRWVAGLQMISDRPLFGFGPANFYSTYRPYTVNSFQTYVSNNPERSGIHNYYLMIAVEQGLIGLLIFMFMVIYLLTKGERMYQSLQSTGSRRLVGLATQWIVIILTISLLNDMIEVVKVGPFFFLAAYLIDSTEE